MGSFIAGWSPIGTATANDTALTTEANKATTSTKPETTSTSGRYVLDVVTELGKASLACFQFLSTGSANQTYGAIFWGWTRWGTDGPWVPYKLGEVSLTAGAKTVSIGGTSYLLPDTIAMDLDVTLNLSMETNGGNLASPADGAAYVTLDPTGHQLLEVEISCESSAATAWVGYRQLSR
ncbi:MAG: hypothetical protein KDA16_11915 [Phycisphaerales bacterium]|nr:hypothetical protein [Phycisphaerales bacterium]